MSFCNDCGDQEPEEAVFCSKCRQPIINDDPTHTVNKPKAMSHQELINENAEEPSAMLTQQKVAPHAHDPSGYSGQWKRRRRRDQSHRISQNGRTRKITLILIVALVVAAIAGALKFVPSVFHHGSNSPHQITVTTYEIPEDGGDITAGPDGNFWFTEGDNAIGRITPDGKATKYLLPTANSFPVGITAGPDGNLWFTEMTNNRIGQVTPSGQITEYPLPNNSFPVGITAGPDGNLWFVGGSNRIGRITPRGQITEYVLPTNGSLPHDIIAGPDGNLWFTEFGNDCLGQITPRGQITEYLFPTPGIEPIAITVGPDHNLWFTERTFNSKGLISGGKIGQITPEGQITEYPLPMTRGSGSLEAIAAGPDGNLWFVYGVGGVDHAPSIVGRITPSGSVTFPIPKTQNSHLLYGQNYQLISLDGITVGSGGNLWMTGSTSNGTPLGGIIMRMTL